MKLRSVNEKNLLESNLVLSIIILLYKNIPVNQFKDS